VPPDVESIYFDNFAVFARDAQRRLLTSEVRERAPARRPRPVRRREGRWTLRS
jgi:hypothetical protein